MAYQQHFRFRDRNRVKHRLFCLIIIINTFIYFIHFSVLLKSTIDENDFQQLLIKISKEEMNVDVEVEADSQEEEYHSNYIEEERSSDEDEDFCASSSDESIIEL